jgi:hypothetical protein
MTDPLTPDDDEVDDDEAPEQDPDPAPPKDASVADHEAEIVRNGYTLPPEE